MAAKHTSCATSSAERPLRSAAPTLARQYRTTIGRMVSSTSRSASRLPATASATTASRRSPENVIVGDLSSVTNGTGTGWVAQLNNNFQRGVNPVTATDHTPPRRRTVSAALVANGRHLCSRVRRAADVGQQARQRPAQRDRCPTVCVVSSAASATRRDRLEFAGAAQRRGQDDVRLEGVASRAERRRQVDGAFGVPDGGRAVAAGHRQFGGHPRQPHRQPRGHRFRQDGQRPDEARPPTPRTGPPRVRRRPARSARRHAPRGRHRRAPKPGRPSRGHGRASRADAETTPVCCAPATPAGPTRCSRHTPARSARALA